jgi:hypothetical protein
MAPSFARIGDSLKPEYSPSDESEVVTPAFTPVAQDPEATEDGIPPAPPAPEVTPADTLPGSRGRLESPARLSTGAGG